MSEINLTPLQAVLVIIVSVFLLYFIATVKATESPMETVEVEPTEKPSPVYLERYGAVIQSQQYH